MTPRGTVSILRTHFDTMLREDLAALGNDLSEEGFAAILLGSLLKSDDSYLSAISATLSILNRKLSPDALMLSVIDEFDHRAVTTRQTKNHGKDAAFHAGNWSKGSRKGQEGSKRNIECYNCHKKGNLKAECWVKGGGKE